MTNWLWKGEPFTSEQIGENFGFVYLLTDTANGRKYLGKKFFWKPGKRMVKVKTGPRAGKSRPQRITKDSDWRTYFGSNPTIMRLAAEDPERFKREILVLCKGRGELAYVEAKLQFENNVLFDDTFYNEVIDVRINAKALKNLKNDYLTGKNISQ